MIIDCCMIELFNCGCIDVVLIWIMVVGDIKVVIIFDYYLVVVFRVNLKIVCVGVYIFFKIGCECYIIIVWLILGNF